MNILSDIRDFVLPRHCYMCEERLARYEKYICTACLMHLPYTNYHLVEHSQLEKQFWGILPIEKAVSLFYYDGYKTRELIHHIKYKEKPEIATYLAHIYAEELKKTHFFDDIDMIVPLPLHWFRQMRRRYNQCHYIAEGIKQVTGIPINTRVVARIRYNVTQTHLSSFDRKENVKSIFKLKHPEKIEGKHILLIDDVVTTGSTILSCGKELAKAKNVRISILTLAVAGGRTPVPDSDRNHVDPSIFGIPLLQDE